MYIYRRERERRREIEIFYLSQLIRTMVTLVSNSYDLFQLVLLVETPHAIVKMVQVINKKARAT